MARVKITEAVFGRNSESFVLALDGASVQVNVAGGSAATVYQDASSGTTIPNPLTSTNGRLPGYVVEGSYELVVTYGGTTYPAVPFEARAAYPAAPSGSTTVFTNDGAGNVAWADPNSIVGAAPWLVQVVPYLSPATQTNWSSRVVSANQLSNGYMSTNPPHSQNAEIGWDVILGAGTWTVDVMYASGANGGITTVSLDGLSIGTFDQYESSGTFNKVGTIPGVSVATTGKKRLLLKQATKNPSSSAYAGAVSLVQMRRTS